MFVKVGQLGVRSLHVFLIAPFRRFSSGPESFRIATLSRKMFSEMPCNFPNDRETGNIFTHRFRQNRLYFIVVYQNEIIHQFSKNIFVLFKFRPDFFFGGRGLIQFYLKKSINARRFKTRNLVSRLYERVYKLFCNIAQKKKLCLTEFCLSLSLSYFSIIFCSRTENVQSRLV